MTAHRFHGPPKTRHDPSEVTALCAAAFGPGGVFGETGHASLREVVRHVITILNGGLDGDSGQDRITYGQVMRAMSGLALSGALIRFSQGRRRPDGSCVYGSPEFWTPAAATAARIAGELASAAREAELARWDLIWQELERRDLRPRHAKARDDILLGASQWETLLGLTPPEPG